MAKLGVAVRVEPGRIVAVSQIRWLRVTAAVIVLGVCAAFWWWIAEAGLLAVAAI